MRRIDFNNLYNMYGLNNNQNNNKSKTNQNNNKPEDNNPFVYDRVEFDPFDPFKNFNFGQTNTNAKNTNKEDDAKRRAEVAFGLESAMDMLKMLEPINTYVSNEIYGTKEPVNFINEEQKRDCEFGVQLAKEAIAEHEKIKDMLFNMQIKDMGGDFGNKTLSSDQLKVLFLTEHDFSWVRKLMSSNEPNIYKDSFYLKLAYKESSLDPENMTKTGTFIGLYQMSPAALEDAGYVEPKLGKKSIVWDNMVWTGKHGINSREDYFNSTIVQHLAVREYHRRNWISLKQVHNKVGEYINDIEITPYGMVAASHLVGVGKVVRFVCGDMNEPPKDGNGTKATKYLKELAQHGDFAGNNKIEIEVLEGRIKEMGIYFIPKK